MLTILLISMRVLIEVYATLQERLGWTAKYIEINAEEITLEDLIREVRDLYDAISPDLGGGLEDLLDSYLVFVNGIHAQFRNGLKTLLRDGDKISIFPPVAGGVGSEYIPY